MLLYPSLPLSVSLSLNFHRVIIYVANIKLEVITDKFGPLRMRSIPELDLSSSLNSTFSLFDSFSCVPVSLSSISSTSIDSPSKSTINTESSSRIRIFKADDQCHWYNESVVEIFIYKVDAINDCFRAEAPFHDRCSISITEAIPFLQENSDTRVG